MFQMMQAIAFMHKHGFFHRDIKPENTLIKVSYEPLLLATHSSHTVLFAAAHRNVFQKYGLVCTTICFTCKVERVLPPRMKFFL